MKSIIEIALNEYGNKNIPGPMNNPEVLKYFTESGYNWVYDDDTAWCAAFVNWVLMRAGKQQSGSLLARGFDNYGEETTQPEMGDIVVMWTKLPDRIYNHVCFFVRAIDNLVYVLGGNQSKQVNIMQITKDRVYSYRKTHSQNDTEKVIHSFV